MRLLLVVAVPFLVSACGGEDGGATVGTGGAGGELPAGGNGGSDPCPAPGRLVEGLCLEPGFTDDGCPAGTVGQDDGSCLPAGVPEDGCGEGFTHDGEQGCTPILPADPCTEEGTMAVPGDTACRPIMSCGSGTWGDIPIDSSTIFVDENYTGGGSDGTQAHPYVDLGDAIAAAAGGELIAIAEGGYIGDFVISKPLTLHGVCPTKVDILGDPFAAGSPLRITAAGSGSTIVGLRFTDLHTAQGVIVEGATGVTFDRIWVKSNILGGLDARWHQTAGSAEITVRDSLFEGNGGNALLIWGSSAVIEGTSVRDMQFYGADEAFGIGASAADAVPADVTVRGCRVEEALGFAVYAMGSSLVVEDTAIQNTLPNSGGVFGRGVTAQYHPSAALRAAVTVRRSVVEDSLGVGIFAASSDLVVENTVVHRIAPDASDQGSTVISAQPSSLGAPADPSGSTLVITHSRLSEAEGTGLYVSGSELDGEGILIRDVQPDDNAEMGRGLYLRADEGTGEATQASLRGAVMERNHDVGVYAIGSVATLEGVVVRDTLADAVSWGGRGVSIQNKVELSLPADITLIGSVVEDNGDHGLLAYGSALTLSGTVVRGTAPGSTGWDGRGVGVQLDVISGTAGALVLDHSLLEDNHGIGLFVSGSSLTMTRSAVLATQPAPAGGLGRGLSIQSFSNAQGPSVATLSDSIVADNHEFGAFIGGSDVTVERCRFSGTRSVDPGGGQLLYGDGIALLEEGQPTVVSVQDTSLVDNGRAAILFFGGALTLGGTTASCNAIDLVDGSSTGAAGSLDNQGNNQCGCPAGAEVCKWQSASVQTPTPLGEADADGSDD
ncbi:MAG: right-handed parallel beta-helix repeat-containing protein [Deltaproteobacteria bacterium]|nr:right-handed parallel beta-helix repeat-containing protein [Deltaproteobacteria bacterium]